MNGLFIFGAKYLYLVIILISFFYFLKQSFNLKKRILLLSICFLPLTLLVSKVLGVFFYNPRPFVAKHFVPLIPHAANNGFPSDHSLISFAFACLVYYFNKKIGLFLFVLAFLVGFSRIYVGVHSLIDVIGSFAIAVITYGFCVKITSWKKV